MTFYGFGKKGPLFMAFYSHKILIIISYQLITFMAFYDCVQTLCNALIMPHFHYCLLVWGSNVKDGHKLHLLQKKAIRVISNSHYIAHTEPICK